MDGQPGELTDDALTRDYRVWQRRRGHRYSLDDVLTAWEAAGARLRVAQSDAESPTTPDPAHRAAGVPARVLDLGCGLGSVLLMLAWKLPDARLVGVEAQSVSMALARRNVARNGLWGRVELVEGDLRDPALVERLSRTPFDLVTATPPYMPPERGVRSPDAQRAHARMELRGGIEDYLRTAAAAVRPGGRVVACADARRPDRALQGAGEAGLRPVRRRDVVPRATKKGALFTVWTFAPTAGSGDEPEHTEPFVARDAGGRRTEAYRAVRRFFGLPGGEDEPPSP